MVEIRIHGRGGQGGVTLAKLIAATRFLQGDSVQAFGLYAAERSGAPIQAFCRYSQQPITNRNLIYEPDHVVVLDPTLIGQAIVDGLKPGGWILLNTAEPLERIAAEYPGYRLASVDATAIARANGLGTQSVPIVNTALAGAMGRILEFDLEHVLTALEHSGLAGPNLTAASQAYEAVRAMAAPSGELPPAAEREAVAAPAPAPSILDGGAELPRIRTGQWATHQPRRQEMLPPCNHVCPAGNDVRGFLQALARDDADEALAILLRTTPFPAVCGRVCPAPCMELCNRIDLDGAVNVRQLERFAGDHGEVAIESAPPIERHVAVIGSGPAGLTAAFHLALGGCRVTVCEGRAETGGLLRTGIPGYRLPDDVVDREIDRIVALGVEIETGARIDRERLVELARNHDAVLVATGLQELRSLRLGVAEAEAVEQGIDFLERCHDGEVRLDGEEVLVVGGGNTALDAARSAVRLGAERVTIVYRRSLLEMPAIREEVADALDEGVRVECLLQPEAIRRDPAAGNDRPPYLLNCRLVELGEPDESGRRRPLVVEGSDFELSCHRVILALGQSPDLKVFPEGTEVREGSRLLGMLETPIFAVGDLATGDGTVAGAIGSGRRAALQILGSLVGSAEEGAQLEKLGGDYDVVHDDVIRSDSLRMHLFERQAAASGDNRMPWARLSNFDEVHAGLEDAGEAKRCLSCGGCNECDRCVTYCPEGVLKRVGHEWVFDYSFCKGCAVCAAECPRNVIFMSHL
jgi:2-oxoacid:acceptor oxidoreductase gamma subunit (pyruvate/2-ketoisovalerate family)